MNAASCIYEGFIRHRRFAPRAHRFRYPLFMMYLDLAELPQVFDAYRGWSARGRALAWFRREDHLGRKDQPLDESVRDLVEERLGWRPEGSICLLTHLRYLGYVFNPVSFFYVFEPSSRVVEAIVAEVSNTPWGERHCYVLDRRQAAGPTTQHRVQKEFHVSPFMGMDVKYNWLFGEPGRHLVAHMENHEQSQRSFDATLVLRRKELSSSALRHVLLRYPWITMKVIVSIHWQALRLWLKGVPFHPHPSKSTTSKQVGRERRLPS